MKNISFIFALLFVLILAGCGEHELVKDSAKESGNGLRLSYKVSGIVSAASRATVPVEEGEDQINSFYILFYDNDIVRGFVEVVDAMSSYSTAMSSVGVLDIEFPEDSNLSVLGDYVMLCLANIEDYREELTSVEALRDFCGTRSVQQVIDHLKIKISGVEPNREDPLAEQADNSNRMAMDNLPMSAIVTKAPRETDVEIELSRGISRFDVLSLASGYELVSASLWNAYTTAYVFGDDSRLLPAHFNGERTERYYGVGTNEQGQIVGSLYAFENYVKEPEQKDKSTTCLIIGLKNVSTNQIEYFRANISATSKGQILTRNSVYKTTVLNISGKGEETERDAYEKGNLLLELNINDWFLDDYGVMQYDGKNLLAMPTRKINLSGQEEVR
ncbi:MAG: hypothetical protein LUD15_02585 [Bacteroides sp.]|nr:hypothetical protein [Bacteroides sp.]